MIRPSLLVGVLGVVYGDIGTSPLYALKVSLNSLPFTPETVVGLVSTFIWLIFGIVTLKYVVLVMRADQEGEGGILILASLCRRLPVSPFVLGVLGTALFWGDGVITPAISVLGALEGLKLVSPFISEYIVGISVILICFLFLFQKQGSHIIGRFFGPVMVLWFFTLAVLGLYHIVQAPSILKALNPFCAFHFLIQHGIQSLWILGGAILVVTGAEALYADMGHFGRRPIRLTWIGCVFPALVLNYLGQGGLLLAKPSAIVHPFYAMVSPEGLYPLLILATFASIIASQSIISGLFSISWQAILLEYLPRMKVLHTSRQNMGQVYVPSINFILAVLTLGAVLIFKDSEHLAGAYGLNVACIMILTTFFMISVTKDHWHWPLYKRLLVFVPLGFLEIIFFIGNLSKMRHGAWYVIGISFCAGYVMRVWVRGNQAIKHNHPPLKEFLENHLKTHPLRLPGTALFMSRHPHYVPRSLMTHLHHNTFLHEKIICTSIQIQNTPDIRHNRFSVEALENNVFIVIARYGFKEIPDFHRITAWIEAQGILVPHEKTSFFISKSLPVAGPRGVLRGWGEKLYIALSRNALEACSFYKISHHKVIELGIRYKV